MLANGFPDHDGAKQLQLVRPLLSCTSQIMAGYLETHLSVPWIYRCSWLLLRVKVLIYFGCDPTSRLVSLTQHKG